LDNNRELRISADIWIYFLTTVANWARWSSCLKCWSTNTPRYCWLVWL